MKILLTISCNLDPNSGAAGTTLRLGQEYARLGHEVSFFTYNNLPKILPDAIKMVTFPELASLHVFNLCYRGRVDVIDSPCGEGWLWSKVLNSFRRPHPLLVTRSHGLENTLHSFNLDEAKKGTLKLSPKYFLYRGSWRLWEEATALRNADLVFLLNRQDAKYATDCLRVEPEKIHVVPNGIPDTFINLPEAVLFESKSKSIRIAQIGSYIQRKGIQYTIPALKAILNRFSHVEVSLLGTGCPEAAIYKDFELNLHPRIKVVPQYTLESLPHLLQDHQIKLFAPLNEGFGKVLVESMACGLAPIVSAAAGPLEVVHNGYDAVVVPIGNAIAIEHALEQLIIDRNYLEKIRRNAYITAQNYSWINVANQRLFLYQEMLDRLANQRSAKKNNKHCSHTLT